MHTHICFRSCALLTLTLFSTHATYSMFKKRTLEKVPSLSGVVSFLDPFCAKEYRFHRHFYCKVKRRQSVDDPHFLAGIISGNMKNTMDVGDFTTLVMKWAQTDPTEDCKGFARHRYVVQQAKKSFVKKAKTIEERVDRMKTLLSLDCNVVGIRQGKKGLENTNDEQSAILKGYHFFYFFPLDMKQKIEKIKPALPEILHGCDDVALKKEELTKDKELTRVNGIFENDAEFCTHILALNIKELQKQIK